MQIDEIMLKCFDYGSKRFTKELGGKNYIVSEHIDPARLVRWLEGCFFLTDSDVSGLLSETYPATTTRDPLGSALKALAERCLLFRDKGPVGVCSTPSTNIPQHGSGKMLDGVG